HPVLPFLPGNIGSDATSGTAGGTAPTFSSFIGAPPTGAGWYFPLNTIDPSPTNEYSQVLIFTSGAGPHMVSSTLLNSGLSAVMDLPSPLPDPLPEPASLALIAVGLAGVFGSRRRK
ncbi:MAG: PEP-CTERM sorting domain-containing protein, partial [Phycisphaerae bacterium]|nr:PEP-CTERM sorting domain-containing protein [Phycisphaerae bacterium]